MPDPTITDILLSRRELIAAHHASSREFRDRIRKLTNAAESLVSAAAAGPELLPQGPTMDPELVALVRNPLKGL